MKTLLIVISSSLFFAACSHAPVDPNGPTNRSWVSGVLKPHRALTADLTDGDEEPQPQPSYRPGSIEFPLAIRFSKPDQAQVKIVREITNVNCGLMSDLSSNTAENKIWFLPSFTSDDVKGLPSSFYQVGLTWKPGEWPLQTRNERNPAGVESVLTTESRRLRYDSNTQTLEILDLLSGGYAIRYILEIEPEMQRIRGAQVTFLDNTPEGKDFTLKNQLLKVDCLPLVSKIEQVNSIPYALFQGLLPTHRN